MWTGKCQQSSKLTENLILKMHDGPPRFGFESRAGQFSYPFLISAMLLAHRYLYPEFPGLRAAEFYLSMGGLALYIASRKFLIGPRFAAFRPQLRMIEKLIEVYIGVTVIASLIFALIVSVAG